MGSELADFSFVLWGGLDSVFFMSIDVKLLGEICKAPGAPGFEIKIRELVLKELKGLCDEVRVDQMGNVIALKKGKSNKKKSMAAAHMDEIGFIVSHIDDKGFVRFNPLGGFDPKTLTAQRVIIHGKKDVVGVMGCKPIHIMTPEERGKKIELGDFYIDTGLTKKQLEKIIEVGSPITRERELIELGDCVNVKSLDNRVSVFILIEALRAIKKSRKKPAYDFYAAFTVQEEVGLRGAISAAHHIDPDFGFGLDTTIAYDLPGAAAHEKITSLDFKYRTLFLSALINFWKRKISSPLAIFVFPSKPFSFKKVSFLYAKFAPLHRKGNLIPNPPTVVPCKLIKSNN